MSTPSPAPRGELSASFVLASIKTELLKRSQDYGAIGDFIPLLEDKVESLTKHAAALSEENRQLRQWSEQAREALEELCHDHRTPRKAKYDALLATHPDDEQATGRAPDSSLDAMQSQEKEP